MENQFSNDFSIHLKQRDMRTGKFSSSVLSLMKHDGLLAFGLKQVVLISGIVFAKTVSKYATSLLFDEIRNLFC
jgi:hypothetical protein